MMQLFLAEVISEKCAAWEVLCDVYADLEDRIPNLQAHKEKLFSKACIICAVNGETTVGMIAFYCNDMISKTAFISHFAVRQTAQKTGIGERLFEKCEEVSRRNGMKVLRLEVCKCNVSAIQFYEHHGLRYEKDVSENSINMIKYL